jgi:hypothetical protein
MSDSPSKRARERRKAQKRREKKARVNDRPPEEDDHETIAARYLEVPEDDDVAPQERAR